MTDTQLARLSRGGDTEAFGILVKRWNGRIFRLLHRLLGDEHEARDACQEAFLRAFVNISRLRNPEHFKAWIHQIALNLCRDRTRADQRRSLHEVNLDEPLAETTPSEHPTPLDLAQQNDLSRRLATVLARLPDSQRTAIVLRECQGFTSTEIAAITGVPAATVRGRIFYGLKAMRRMLPEHAPSSTPLNDGGPS